MIAVLAILKAGCVFVPLDADTPPKRLSELFAELDLTWLITDRDQLCQVSKAAGEKACQLHVVCTGCMEVTDDVWSFRSLTGIKADFVEEAYCPQCFWEPDDMCYIYFTSGSTGRPKGIAGRLKGLDHFIRWEITTFGVTDHTHVSQLTPPSFDPFLRDVFVPLYAGGTLCIPPSREEVLDGRKLLRWIGQEQINLVHCVPSLFRLMINDGSDVDALPTLKYILLAGERLLPSDVGRWVDTFGERVQLVNLYGPTETTLAKLFYLVQPADRHRRSIPIGQPIDGARVLVMDAQGHPCAPGMVGEIYIRTPFRSLGYYKRPDLTKEVFVPNPFNDSPNDLIYRTGDYGRLLDDGNLEYLGRRDQQVKVRGMRVELGELENILRMSNRVRDVVVVEREDSRKEKVLCAYIVVEGDVEIGELKNFLRQYVPENLVPPYFVTMDELPHTLSGKVDRRALPAPEWKRSVGRDDAFVAPRTPTEEILAEIWCSVLKLDFIGVYDNFFDLGGHSLLATQVISRVRDAFQVEVPLTYLFEAPTVARMAMVLVECVGDPVSVERTAQMLLQLAYLSDEEAEALFEEKEEEK